MTLRLKHLLLNFALLVAKITAFSQMPPPPLLLVLTPPPPLPPTLPLTLPPPLPSPLPPTPPPSIHPIWIYYRALTSVLREDMKEQRGSLWREERKKKLKKEILNQKIEGNKQESHPQCSSPAHRELFHNAQMSRNVQASSSEQVRTLWPRLLDAPVGPLNDIIGTRRRHRRPRIRAKAGWRFPPTADGGVAFSCCCVPPPRQAKPLQEVCRCRSSHGIICIKNNGEAKATPRL